MHFMIKEKVKFGNERARKWQRERRKGAGRGSILRPEASAIAAFAAFSDKESRHDPTNVSDGIKPIASASHPWEASGP
jgi:hypothetical protein